jgi:hypothetical protein
VPADSGSLAAPHQRHGAGVDLTFIEVMPLGDVARLACGALS